jgi:CRP/FNR family transcriptional regulator, nitrogen fixation regulation protein
MEPAMLTSAVVHNSQARAQSSRPRPVPPTLQTLLDTVELTGAVLPFDRNAEVYGENEPAEYVYKVLTGSVRTYKVLHDGRRQIDAFYLPGDIFGLELGDEHSCSAEAIADSTVLVVRRSLVLAAAEKHNDVARRLWSHTARDLRRAQHHTLLLIKSAQERVAAFLLEMAERLSAGASLELPMSRQDIADYLGLTIETVSRTLSQLEGSATIALPASRRIVLRNRMALTRLND